MNQEIGKLNASFSVSNTDVITMLVVKNREVLNEQKIKKDETIKKIIYTF